jgi:Protein of unknown function (DUF551)
MSKWVPCSERMPEEGVYVLVTVEPTPYNSWLRKGWTAVDYHRDGQWWNDGRPYVLTPTHWHPLPEWQDDAA